MEILQKPGTSFRIQGTPFFNKTGYTIRVLILQYQQWPISAFWRSLATIQKLLKTLRVLLFVLFFISVKKIEKITSVSLTRTDWAVLLETHVKFDKLSNPCIKCNCIDLVFWQMVGSDDVLPDAPCNQLPKTRSKTTVIMFCLKHASYAYRSVQKKSCF